MMKMHSFVPLYLLAMSLTFAFTGVLFSQEPSARGKSKAPANPLFSVLDRDGNKTLDPYEALASLLDLEAELDGKPLTQGRLEKLLQQREKAEKEEITGMLASMDANGDGKTEIAEMDESMRGFAELLDGNQDGVITFEEAKTTDISDAILMSPEAVEATVQELFENLDKNKDRVLVSAEVDGDTWAELSGYDTNHDQKLAKAEYERFLKADNTHAVFRVKGDRAYMEGVISAKTPARVLRLIWEHPQVRTIEMVHVPGSIDDEANLRAARWVRHFGFTTVLGSHSSVASGGTDFFLAGKHRIVEKGARAGIHSWGGPGFQGKDVPKDDPQHRLYLDYYEEMGIPAAFYWRTLEAAPAQEIHWMTDAEFKRYAFRTPAKGKAKK